MLQLNVHSQQSTIDNLNDKAQTLKRSSQDDNLGNQIRNVIGRYEALSNKAKVRRRYKTISEFYGVGSNQRINRISKKH